MIAQRQYEDKSYAGFYNVGPDDRDCVTTGELVDMFCNLWGNGAAWEKKSDHGPHEANFLKLDCSKLKSVFGWRPVWNVEQAVEKTVEWIKTYKAGNDVLSCMEQQIKLFYQKSEGKNQNA